jgi:hypothetical protein
MAILKNKLKIKYTQLPNAAITDTRLSDTSFRILSYLFSRNDGWIVNNQDIKMKLGIKNDKTMANKWKELTASGWVKRSLRYKDTNEGKSRAGQFDGGYDIELIDLTNSLDDLLKSTDPQKERNTKKHQFTNS